MRPSTTTTLALGLALVIALAACGDDRTATGGAGDRPTVVVTTNVLGDVVTNLVGEAAEVVVIMPAGSDPHDFQASAQQVDQMASADALITNGASFEAGLDAAIEAAEAAGAPVHHAIDDVDALDVAEEDHGHDEEGDAHTDEGETDDHAEEGEDGHEHEGVDPHFFTDPRRMADAADGIAAFLAEELPALATDDVRSSTDAYVDELRELDTSVADTLSAIPADDRILITNHEVFGYFADRYDFEVVGVVIPGGTAGGEPSAANLADLVHVIEEEGVPAIFADTSSPTRLADTLAAEAGSDVEVVEVFSESLGDEGSGGETYVDMVTTNADRIADALT